MLTLLCTLFGVQAVIIAVLNRLCKIKIENPLQLNMLGTSPNKQGLMFRF
jgi:hypothetical protein